jgi:pyruvate dehydrogenase E2 component (dihydrolipoamide acetyltransferase)
MGESIYEGTITKWLKNVGDKVTRDEPLFEISTDKVDSEVPSPADGVLAEILAPAGQTVQINAVVAIIAESATEAAEPEPFGIAGSEVASVEPAAVEGQAPEVALRGPVASLVPAAEAPPAMKEPVRESAAPGESPIATELPAAAEEAAAPRLETGVASIATPQGASRAEISHDLQAENIRTSPLVRRIARDHGVDLSQVEGTGLSGRITKEDILRHLELPARKQEARPFVVQQPPAAPAGKKRDTTAPCRAAPEPQGSGASVESSTFQGEAETVTMTPMRKSIAEHMVLSRRTSAHVQTVFEVDMTSVVAMHNNYKDEFERREGFKLTYTPFFVKALVDTVRDYPILNCSVSGDEIVFRKQINVGIAVALDTGLIVPVVKDAHLKSFTVLANAIHDVAERARTKKLKPDEVQQGTITITNPGVFGALFGTPIIHQPQVAILDVGTLEKRPIIINDAIAIRTMVYLVLSFDHRVIDGAVADQFMAALKSRLQSWTQWVE